MRYIQYCVRAVLGKSIQNSGMNSAAGKRLREPACKGVSFLRRIPTVQNIVSIAAGTSMAAAVSLLCYAVGVTSLTRGSPWPMSPHKQSYVSGGSAARYLPTPQPFLTIRLSRISFRPGWRYFHRSTSVNCQMVERTILLGT